jgi:hypothetical protein
MATAFLILRATELGLVAHPVAGYKEAVVKEILNIPDEMQIITLVNVGKHSNILRENLTEKQKETEKIRPDRLPLDKFAYLDRYGNAV